MVPGSLIHRVITGQPGMLAGLLRGVAGPLSAIYGVAVALRNARFDRGMGVRRVDVPVISVGNITAGGTGKTPLVIHLSHRLMHSGHRVGVVARGYRGEPQGTNDELRLITDRVPGVIIAAHGDRVRAAEQAIKQGASVLLADDGFQHRRLHRDLDLVTIDATNPFGYGRLIPRGLLREPVGNLRRAQVLVITRADLVSPEELGVLRRQLAQAHPGMPTILSRHRPVELIGFDGRARPIDFRQVGPVHVAAGIGNNAALVRTLEAFKPEVRGTQWYPDHHRYQRAEVTRMIEDARVAGAKAVLVTEKDLVKLRGVLASPPPLPILALRVDLDFMDDGARILDEAVDRVLQGRRTA